MRLFVAVNLPVAERQRVFEATAPLRQGRFPFRWIVPESMHVTLRFLGNVGAEDIGAIRGALAGVADRHEPFPMKIGGVGGFPNLRRPRVVWASVNGGDTLLSLQRDVERTLVPLGFEPEHRAWSPHLTLGRAEQRARAAGFSGLAAVAESVTVESFVDVESIDLMRSHTGPGGARYELMEKVALNARTGTQGRQEVKE